MKLNIMTIALLGLFSSSTMAANNVSAPAGQWLFGGKISQFTLDNTVAAQEGVSNSAWALSIDANYIQSDWLTTLSLEFLSYSDKQNFKQRVEGDGWSIPVTNDNA